MADLTGMAPPRRRRTSTAAILGLVLSVIGIAPLGLGLSVIGLRETRDGEVEGRWIAVAGAVIGAFGSAVLLVLLILWTQSRG